MKWLQKTAVISCAVGVLASFATMVPTSHSTEAAIAVFDAKNIEEAIKIAIQTAKIITLQRKNPSDIPPKGFFYLFNCCQPLYPSSPALAKSA